MDDCCQCKGINFLGFLQAAQDLHPDLPLEALLATSPPEMRQLLRDGTLLTGEWYPVSWYNTLHQGLRSATGAGPEICWDVGYASTRQDFEAGGIYRHLVRLLSPNTVLGLGQKIFSFYWDPGRLATRKLGRKKAWGRWEQCQGFNENTWQDILGGTVFILQLTGAHEPTLNVVAGGGDQPFLEAEATWL